MAPCIASAGDEDAPRIVTGGIHEAGDGVAPRTATRCVVKVQGEDTCNIKQEDEK